MGLAWITLLDCVELVWGLRKKMATQTCEETEPQKKSTMRIGARHVAMKPRRGIGANGAGAQVFTSCGGDAGGAGPMSGSAERVGAGGARRSCLYFLRLWR